MMNIIKSLKLNAKIKANKNLVIDRGYEDLLQKPVDYIYYELIETVFEKLPREDWYEFLCRFLYTDEQGICRFKCKYYEDEKYDNFYALYFKLEDLKRDHYNIEPGTIVKHRRYGGQFVCLDYIKFDKRYEAKCKTPKGYAIDLRVDGSTLNSLGINRYGVVSGFYTGLHKKANKLMEENSSYYDYCKSDYVPQYGQVMWYFQKYALYEAELYDKEYYDKVICHATIDLYKDYHKQCERAFKILK